MSIVRTASTGRAALGRQTRLFSIFGGSSAQQVPLDEEFPGVPAIASTSMQAPSTDVTTLANGVRVVSCDAMGPVSTMGVFFGLGGSRNDPAPGASQMISAMAFAQRSANKTGLRVVRDLENAGASATSGATRESLYFTGSCLQPYLRTVAESIAEVAVHPQFRAHDVAEGKHTLATNVAHADTASKLADALFTAAFYDSETLGKPVGCPADRVKDHSSSGLAEYMDSMLSSPSSIVVAGTSVSHSDLVAIAEAQFGQLSGDAAAAGPAAEYVGGEARVHGGGSLTSVSLAFPAAGKAGSAPFAVLAEVLGSGSLFTRGRGIGASRTRLGQGVPEASGVRSADGFCCTHSDAGLVGVTAEVYGDQAGAAIEFLASTLKDMGSATDEEVAAAKNRLKRKISTASSACQLQEMAAQVLTSGSVSCPMAAVDAVTAADVRSAAAAALKSAPTIASLGDVSGVPRYNKVAAMFQ